MSNTRHLQRISPGSGQLCRPRTRMRFPRSAYARWQLLQAIEKARQPAIKIPALPDPGQQAQERVLEATGLMLTPDNALLWEEAVSA